MDLNRRNQAGIRPLSDLVVSPDHDVGALSDLRGHRETVSDLFRRLYPDPNAVIAFKFLYYWLQGMPAIVVEPHRKFAIRPGQQMRRNQTESRNPQQPVEGGSLAKPARQTPNARRGTNHSAPSGSAQNAVPRLPAAGARCVRERAIPWSSHPENSLRGYHCSWGQIAPD